MRVLFWGTPGFALPTLRAVAGAGHEIVGVVTRPDRPRGRGRLTQPSPVRRFADEVGYPVLTPESPRGDVFEEAARRLEPDVSVVVAYGCILDRRALDIPVRGSFNLHASLLPALRGAAPVNWAIARGHTETGVSFMRMVEAMDAGPVLAQERAAIAPADTASSLAGRLAELGARLVAETLHRLESGAVREKAQDHAAATFAPKVDRNAARVDWRRDADGLVNLIRGMDAVPGAWTRWGGDPVKVFSPEAVPGAGDAPGEIVKADPRRGLLVASGRGLLSIREVQPAGRRRMDSAAWIRGRGPKTGDRFE